MIASCQRFGWISTFCGLTWCILTNKIQERESPIIPIILTTKTYQHLQPVLHMQCNVACWQYFFRREQVTVTVPYPHMPQRFLRKYPVKIISKIPCLFSAGFLEWWQWELLDHQIRVDFSHHNTVNGDPNARCSIGPPPRSQCSRLSYS